MAPPYLPTPADHKPSAWFGLKFTENQTVREFSVQMQKLMENGFADSVIQWASLNGILDERLKASVTLPITRELTEKETR